MRIRSACRKIPCPWSRSSLTSALDIDISGDAFGLRSSIRVFHIQFSQRQNRDGDCIRSDGTRLGSYGTQGDYHWRGSKGEAARLSQHLTFPAQADADKSTTARSSSIGGIMRATTASKRSATESGRAFHRTGPPPTHLAPETVHQTRKGKRRQTEKPDAVLEEPVNKDLAADPAAAQ